MHAPETCEARDASSSAFLKIWRKKNLAGHGVVVVAESHPEGTTLEVFKTDQSYAGTMTSIGGGKGFGDGNSRFKAFATQRTPATAGGRKKCFAPPPREGDNALVTMGGRGRRGRREGVMGEDCGRRSWSLRAGFWAWFQRLVQTLLFPGSAHPPRYHAPTRHGAFSL